MTPLLNSQIHNMDKSRSEFIDALTTHIDKLREELRINELILHSVVRSLSNQTEEMAELDAALHNERIDSSRHRPMMVDNNVLARIGDDLQDTVRHHNNLDKK
jgi:hypothetical protein